MTLFRLAARSAQRALSRASSSAIRPSVRPTSLLRSRPAFIRPQVSAFSTSILRSAPSTETEAELSVKLKSEIEFEQDVKENEPVPASIKDFLENSPFEVKDISGKEEVVLTRTFNNEKITVTFSIADLQNFDPDLQEDPALEDEDLEDSRNPTGRTASQEAAELADEEIEGAGGEASVPCRLRIIIEKPGQGALNVEATATDGTIIVENLYHYSDPALAYVESADASHKAQDVYPGPPFGSLDEDLQILMERYLEERGISQALAVFVPDYMDMKEQKEYVAWLKKVRSFVDAA